MIAGLGTFLGPYLERCARDGYLPAPGSWDPAVMAHRSLTADGLVADRGDGVLTLTDGGALMVWHSVDYRRKPRQHVFGDPRDDLRTHAERRATGDVPLSEEPRILRATVDGCVERWVGTGWVLQ